MTHAVVVLAFGFLLVAAASLPSQQPQAVKPKGTKEQQQNQSVQHATAGYKPSADYSAHRRDYQTQNLYDPAARLEGPPVWFQETATILVLLFTCGLWLTSIWQWRAIKEQARLARRALVADRRALAISRRSVDTAQQSLALQFRPKMIVRNIVLDPLPPRPNGTSLPVLQHHPLTGQFYIANVGGSVATIKEILSLVFWTEPPPLPMRRPYEGRDGQKPSSLIRLQPGQSVPRRFDSEQPLDVNPDQILRWSDSGSGPRIHLYVMGWVEYADDLGYIRRTAFCRKFEPQSVRFKAVDDPDYEHAE